MTSGIQAIVSREPKKWTKLYLYKSYFDHRLKHCDFNRTQDKEALGLRIRAVETLGYTSTCKNSGIDKRQTEFINGLKARCGQQGGTGRERTFTHILFLKQLIPWDSSE